MAHKTRCAAKEAARLPKLRQVSRKIFPLHLIAKNTEIFREMGPALEKYARPDVKVVVVANPANTNCLTLMNHAPSLPKENFSALMRLDHNRAAALTARQVNYVLRGKRPGRAEGVIEDPTRISASEVANVIIWGNHSASQFPDVSVQPVCARVSLSPNVPPCCCFGGALKV